MRDFRSVVLNVTCLVLRDCMKGDETENKKIGCTVNLLVRLVLHDLCYFTYSLTSRQRL